jgi:hypothetical protein
MSETPECAVEFEFTPEDWESVNADHLSRSPLQKKALRQAQTVFVAGFGLMGVLSLLAGLGFMALVWAIGGLSMGALIGPIHRSSQRKALRKLGVDGVANGTFGPHRVEVRSDGLVDRTPDSEWVVRWHAIERVTEHDGTLLVYNGPNSFLPIPRTAFRDSETLRSFADGFYRRLNAARSKGGLLGEGGGGPI